MWRSSPAPSATPSAGWCRLRSALHRAQQAFLASLDEVVLADLVQAPTGPLLRRLDAPAYGVSACE